MMCRNDSLVLEYFNPSECFRYWRIIKTDGADNSIS